MCASSGAPGRRPRASSNLGHAPSAARAATAPRVPAARLPPGARTREIARMPRPIATNRRVDRDELLAFVRPRHHVILATTRADGSAQVSPVTAGVDTGGRLVVSTYPQRAKVGEPPTSSRRVGVRLVGRVERPVGPGRRHRRGARSSGRAGAADRVLPKHLGRAPGLGRVPRARCSSKGSVSFGSPSIDGVRSRPGDSRPSSRDRIEGGPSGERVSGRGVVPDGSSRCRRLASRSPCAARP